MAWKLEETRKYYDMYNTLDTTLNFLQKEVKLLNSISENFHEAMRSSQSKVEFSKQFESIVQGVEVRLFRCLSVCILQINDLFLLVLFPVGLAASTAKCSGEQG